MKYSRLLGKHAAQKGFTLIEMMVVTVVLGILITIGIINVQSANLRAKEAAVRSNMHSFQNLIELYAADYDGFYPASVALLLEDPEISQQQLLTELVNPFSSLKGIGNAYDDEANEKEPGLITYSAQADMAGYAIYGYDSTVQRLTQNGTELIMSNK